MAKENESIAKKNVVFMLLDFFCLESSIINESDGSLTKYFKVPEVKKMGFYDAVGFAINSVFLDDSLRDVRITKEIMVKKFENSMFQQYWKCLDISSEQIVEALEFAELYPFVPKENHSEIYDTIKYLYEKGYNLILRDDKPEGFLIEVMMQMGLKEYFKSIQGLIGNYPTFSVESMRELIGENDPKEFLIVTSEIGKTSIIKSAEEVGIPVIILKGLDITKLKELL